MKRKTLSLTLCLLTCLALIGVGFAAWIITATDTQTRTGNIEVDTVTDNRYSLDVTPAEGSAQSIIFGAPATMNDTNATWLTNSGGADKTESLEATFTVKVLKGNDAKGIAVNYNGGDPVAEAPTMTVGVSVFNADDSANTAWATAIAQHVVSDFTVEITSATTDENGTVYTVKVIGHWGSAFNNADGTPINPYNYYNDGTKTAATHGEEAVTNLGYVAALANAKYKLTLTVA